MLENYRILSAVNRMGCVYTNVRVVLVKNCTKRIAAFSPLGSTGPFWSLDRAGFGGLHSGWPLTVLVSTSARKPRGSPEAFAVAQGMQAILQSTG